MARRPARESQKVAGFAAKRLLPRAQGVKTKILLEFVRSFVVWEATVNSLAFFAGSSRSYCSFVQPRRTHIVSTEECM